MLVVAKAPVLGLAKTRLATDVGAESAADLAAAALLDVLDQVRVAPALLLVALTGDLAAASRGDEVRAALAGADVFAQRGDDFADRLANAHADAHARVPDGTPVLQVGMDTPQLSGALLAESLAVATSADAALGPAEDGGWWGLAVRDPAWAESLRDVPMSRPDTGALTQAGLERVGAHVWLLPALRDVDTWDDALAVARTTPESRFAAAVAGLAPGRVAR